MRPKKYLVDLSLGERQTLEKLTTSKYAAYQINHARMLLKADVNQPEGGWSDVAISAALDLGTAILEPVRGRFVEQGLQAALSRRPGSGRKQRRLDGEQEAHLIALVCSEAPQGRGR